MSHAPDNKAGPIPVQWKNDVLAILRRHCKAIEDGKANDDIVTIGRDASRTWYSTFPNSTFYERNEAMTKALLAYNVTGIRYDFDYGEAYDFMFEFRDQSMYGKIALTTSRRAIIICSIHPPDYGDVII